MSAKQAINDKVQGSGATYLMCGPCGGVVNNQIKKGLLQSYTQERGGLLHFARLANTLLKTKESSSENFFKSVKI